ncbi:MAG: hypothetical protein JWM04_17 [Verrucomicrobiales bacterium]|nr:hypothetical protein [Verrucomicrobiales bacterium]
MKTELIDKIIQLRSQGRAHHQIAQITGFCTRTVGRVLQKYSHEFALREADIMEITYQKSRIGPHDRAFYEAAYLRRIEEEFNSLSLSAVPTDKLAKMVIAARKGSDIYQDRVKRNAAESMLQSEEVIFTEEDEHPIREPQQDTRTGSAQFAGTHQPPTAANPQPQAPQSSFVPSVVPAKAPSQTSPSSQPVEAKEIPNKHRCPATSNNPTHTKPTLEMASREPQQASPKMHLDIPNQ